jgi:hypothetical protein
MTIKQHGGVFGRNPSFNDVEVQSLTIAGNAVPDASTILVDGDIGSTVQGYDADTAKLDVAQTFSASQTFTSAVNIEAAGEPQLNLQIGGLTYGHFRLDSGDLVIGTGTTGIKFYDFASAVAPATATTGGLVNNSLDLGSSSFNWRSAYIGTSVVMANGAGIDFSATAGTGTSELFADYEEGTFTPTFNNLTLGNGTTEGRYTKIGRNVILEVNVTWGSTTSASGAWSVSNIPFAAAATHRAYGHGNILDSGTANHTCMPIITESQSSLYFSAINASGTYTTYGNVSGTVPMTWATGDFVKVNIVYTAA